MVLAAPTLPAPGLSHACDMNAALLYASVSLVGTHAGLWTTE